jgi:hypothetical protein
MNRDSEIGYLKGVTDVYVDFVINNPHKSNFLVHLLGYRTDPEFDRAFREWVNMCALGISRVIRTAKKRGTIKTKVSSKTLAFFFVTQYFSVVAIQDFIAPKYFTKDVIYKLMRQLLYID